jgi:hypothetical protein
MRSALLLALALFSCSKERPPELSESGPIDLPGADRDRDAGGGGGGGGGACSLKTGRFSRACVYLIGSVSDSDCRLGVVATADPTVSDVGFPCRVTRARVRASDGRLVYVALRQGIRVFEPEPRDKAAYPSSPTENDALIPTPGCAEPNDFYFFPDDGKLAYRCGSSLYVDGSDDPLLTSPGDFAIAVGPERSALLVDSGGNFTVHREAGPIEVQGLKIATLAGAVFGRSAFLVAGQTETGRPIELFTIQVDGTWARAGEYPRGGWSHLTLASDGTLYGTVGGIVEKVPVGAGRESIYDETNNRVTTGYASLAVP